MKKSLIMALACSFFAVNAVNAQSETYYGSEQGGFAITVGAEPVINFVGNMFNGTTDNALEGLGSELAGKYFVTDQFAVTAGLGIDNTKGIAFTYGDTEEPEDITSKSIYAEKMFSLSLGGQYLLRPGKRLQPFVGANILYGRMNTVSTVKDFEFENDYYEQFDATTKNAEPNNVFGVMANLGFEYYFKQNISISAALDLGVYNVTMKEVSEYETDDKDVDDDYIDSMNYNKKTGKALFFKTGLMNGNIALNFYF